MYKSQDYKKEQIRGIIKEIMRSRGLRTISLVNYSRFNKNHKNNGIHSVKINLEDGYMHIYGTKDNIPDSRQSGGRIKDVTMDIYNDVYNQVMDILEHENEIPSSVKRNILVKINR